MVTARQAPPIASPTRLSSIHRHRRQTPDQTPDQAAEGEEVPRRLAAPAASPSAGISISGWASASRIAPGAGPDADAPSPSALPHNRWRGEDERV